MKLALFVSAWGNELSIGDAILHARVQAMDGIEAPPPTSPSSRAAAATHLDEYGLHYIAEIVTGGGYAPNPSATAQQHLDDLDRQIEAAMDLRPLKFNCLLGIDAWASSLQIDVFGKALERIAKTGTPAVFETHRSRPTFNPWHTRDLLAALPELRLNCDFSHWCAVAERLVMNDDPVLLNKFAERCDHLHARVGYEQGPQVPDPRAPEYAEALTSHLNWWQTVWLAQQQRGTMLTTMTPEFGPDGYLHRIPFTGTPVADLRELNQWMADNLRSQWTDFLGSTDRHTTPPPQSYDLHQ